VLGAEVIGEYWALFTQCVEFGATFGNEFVVVWLVLLVSHNFVFNVF
jgi:hypothetical protein